LNQNRIENIHKTVCFIDYRSPKTVGAMVSNWPDLTKVIESSQGQLTRKTYPIDF